MNASNSRETPRFDVRPQGAARLPRVWLLASPHSGDNTQLTALADALGWPFEIKRLGLQIVGAAVAPGEPCLARGGGQGAIGPARCAFSRSRHRRGATDRGGELLVAPPRQSRHAPRHHRHPVGAARRLRSGDHDAAIPAAGTAQCGAQFPAPAQCHRRTPRGRGRGLVGQACASARTADRGAGRRQQRALSLRCRGGGAAGP